MQKYSSQKFAMYVHAVNKELENFKKENRKSQPIVSDSFTSTFLDKQISLQQQGPYAPLPTNWKGHNESTKPLTC